MIPLVGGKGVCLFGRLKIWGLFQLGVKQEKNCLSKYLSKNLCHSSLQTKKHKAISGQLDFLSFCLIETAPLVFKWEENEVLFFQCEEMKKG